MSQVQTFLDAARHGNVEVVQALLSHGVDVNVADQDGQTALFAAAKQGNVEVVQALLSHGVDVNVTDQVSQTALFPAARHGNVEVVQALLSHGVDVNVADQDGQTALFAAVASGDLEITTSLLKCGAIASVVDINGKTVLGASPIKNRLPTDVLKILEMILSQGAIPHAKLRPSWLSKSKRHKNVLTEVDQGKNARQTGSLLYHHQTIGSGSLAFVFAGINTQDGREVALKRIQRMQMCQQSSMEKENLIHLQDCEHVVRYLSYREDKDFLYIVLELMEGTLEELMAMDVLKEEVKKEGISLCRDVLSALEWLDEKGIVHRNIKPDNVLYKFSKRLSLKLGGFGLSVSITNSSVHTTTDEARCWIAPELLKGTVTRHSKASDMFACGLVLHYLLSGKKHPFSPGNEAGKSACVVQNETEANILNNKVMVDSDLSHEAQDLVEMMVDQNKDHRPSAAEALRHPLFWSNQKKLLFLIAVGNQPTIFHSRRRRYILPAVHQDLENNFYGQFATNTWDKDIPELYNQMCTFRPYRTNSVVNLLRLLRNAHGHIPELSATAKTEVFAFCTKFPTLLMCAYKSVTRHGWNQRKDIAFAMEAV